MKKCTKCQQEKSLENFGFKSKEKGILQSWCKECHSAYTREHYKNNRQFYYDKNERRELRTQDFIRKLKEGPCTDCGGTFHFSAMDFDHLDSSTKLFNVSRMARYGSGITSVLAEIAKCELVCSNCHRVRSFNRKKPRASTPTEEGARLDRVKVSVQI